MAHYISKYLTKSVILSAPRGTRRYTTSRGIQLNKRWVHSGQRELFGSPRGSTWTLAEKSIEQYYYMAAPNVMYCRCTHGRGNCSEKPIREESLAQLLGEPLKRLRITDERLEWIVEALRASQRDKKAFRRAELRRLEADLEKLERKIDAADEDKLAGVVAEAFWRRKHREYREQQDHIRQLLVEHDDANSAYLEGGVRILELDEKRVSTICCTGSVRAAENAGYPAFELDPSRWRGEGRTEESL